VLKVSRELQEHKVPLVIREHKVLKEPLQELKVIQVLKGQQEDKVHKVLKGLRQELKELLDHRVQQELKGLRERQQVPKVILEHKGL
jgi:mRNA-degrading endonuclease YafQ of YafQ-DinJ toxin-antitoxin module